MSGKYQILKLIKTKKPFSNKYVTREEKVYPYRIHHLGHAIACARVVNSSINYNDKLHDKVLNVIVQDEFNNVVFEARQNVDGIPGKEVEYPEDI